MQRVEEHAGIGPPGAGDQPRAGRESGDAAPSHALHVPPHARFGRRVAEGVEAALEPRLVGGVAAEAEPLRPEGGGLADGTQRPGLEARVHHEGFHVPKADPRFRHRRSERPRARGPWADVVEKLPRGARVETRPHEGEAGPLGEPHEIGRRQAEEREGPEALAARRGGAHGASSGSPVAIRRARLAPVRSICARRRRIASGLARSTAARAMAACSAPTSRSST